MKFYNKDINTIAINALIDCGEILLPSIGALRCKLLPATIKNGSIAPPRQIVEFHCSSRTDTNSLIQLIAWSYSITLDEAEAAYNSWSNNIKAETPVGITFTIGGLGAICISKSSTIFTTDKKFVIQLNPLTQEFSQEEQVIEKPCEPKQIDIPCSNKQKEEKDSNNEPFWKNMSVVFITLFIISTACAIFFYMKEPKVTIREIKIEKVITDTVYVTDAKMSGTTDYRITNGKFHIIAGVFKSQANAEKAVKEFTKEGITPIMEFIKPRNEFFVSVGSFNTQQEAQKQLNTLGLANEDTLESHWIYKY